nr:hypothetical protein [uncultured Cohaesibacter sp.]
MLKVVHRLAGVIALMMILIFWLSTILSELFADDAVVTIVKTLIPWGFWVLIPAIALVGVSGFRVGRKWKSPIVKQKQKRMPFIAINGIVILIPAALYLSSKATAGQFDEAFYLVQAIEIVAGAINISLLGLNMRDGFRLRGTLKPNR